MKRWKTRWVKIIIATNPYIANRHRPPVRIFSSHFYQKILSLISVINLNPPVGKWGGGGGHTV